MRKSKYGEETVAVRVPRSRKQDVLVFLKQFEVIDSVHSDLKELKESSDVYSYKKGYAEGFKRGEELQYMLGVSLVGTPDEIEIQMDLWRNRVPDSMIPAAFERLSTLYLKEGLPDLSRRLFSLSNFLESDSYKLFERKNNVQGIIKDNNHPIDNKQPKKNKNLERSLTTKNKNTPVTLKAGKMAQVIIDELYSDGSIPHVNKLRVKYLWRDNEGELQRWTGTGRRPIWLNKFIQAGGDLKDIRLMVKG